MNYFAKMKGTTKSPPGVGIAEIGWSWLGGSISGSARWLLWRLMYLKGQT